MPLLLTFCLQAIEVWTPSSANIPILPVDHSKTLWIPGTIQPFWFRLCLLPFLLLHCPEVLLQNGVTEHWYLVSLESYAASQRKEREIPACDFVFPCFWKIQKWMFLSAFMLCSWSLLFWWLSSWKQCERNVSVHRHCLWTIQTIALSKELSLPVVCHCHTLYAASTKAGITPHGR